MEATASGDVFVGSESACNEGIGVCGDDSGDVS